MRLVVVRPARADLKIPWPGTDRLLVDGRVVDVEAPYWAGHLADGSIVEVEESAASFAPEAPVATADTSSQHEG